MRYMATGFNELLQTMEKKIKIIQEYIVIFFHFSYIDIFLGNLLELS